MRAFAPIRRTPAALAVLAVAAASVAAVPPPAAAEVAGPLTLRHDDTVYGDVLIAGDAVLGCPRSPAKAAKRCRAAMRGENGDNNNQFVMTRVKESAAVGAYDSSVARLTVPAGARVSYARLFWGGNTGTYRSAVGGLLNRCDISGADVDPAPGDPMTSAPVIAVAGGPATPVPPENAAASSESLNGPHYYTAEGDVTSLFAAAPTGSPVDIAVGDVWAPNGAGCVGGWSVAVVYEFAGPNAQAPSRRHVHIYGGHVLQRSNDAPTTVTVDGFHRYGTAPVRATLTAHEGDRAASGDQFRVNGTNIPNPRTGETRNFFAGRADGADTVEVGSPYNLGTDVDALDLPGGVIPEGATSADLTLSTRGDTYVLQEVSLSVPVPDLLVTKTSPGGIVKPGDVVTFTITAENTGEVDYPGASFTDDLSEVLDDADWVSATADLGEAGYTAPVLRWSGDVPAGAKATVTYRLRVRDPDTGDGRLLNNVLVASGSLVGNCEKGSTDPACAVAVTVPGAAPPQHGTPRPGTALAATGRAAWILAAAGAVLIALGAAGLWLTRRRG
ncbi:hypothetical protein Afil01_03070 [Actinorhabdospora filicis]|uniref:DUF7927 domain-containing protein n=1 Tax=Actinorhabdospora filicis TaxID=1785913 RepID=A0A9W6W8B7_9ACTN|nr:hypothetical protein [Actinorhabdospora filicis]GLZ75500.1 hypothetical protein Afil01_03070 [Actinorhabdospora filicis]